MYKKFWNNRRGQFAIMFAFFTFPLLAAIGMAMEYANITNQRAKLQNAVDAAILFAGGHFDEYGVLPSRNEVEGFVDSNFDGAFSVKKFDQIGDDLALSVDTDIPSYFFGKVYPSVFDQNVSATIPRPQKTYTEIAMVLDNTYSMTTSMDDSDKITILKSVANSFVDKLIAARNLKNEVKIGLVPFSQYVNIGEKNKFKYWVEAVDDPDDWTPCVGSRPEPHTLSDGVTNERAAGVLKLVQFPAARDLYKFCPAPIVDLTHSSADLKNGIAAMEPWGGTYIGEGVAWGQRVLSHVAPLTRGKKFGSLAPSVTHNKYMLVLTDGDNAKGPSIPLHNALGWIGDVYTKRACENARAVGITIFTIAFGDEVSGDGKEVMRDCAGDEGGYYEAKDAKALQKVFDDIFVKAIPVRLSS